MTITSPVLRHHDPILVSWFDDMGGREMLSTGATKSHARRKESGLRSARSARNPMKTLHNLYLHEPPDSMSITDSVTIEPLLYTTAISGYEK